MGWYVQPMDGGEEPKVNPGLGQTEGPVEGRKTQAVTEDSIHPPLFLWEGVHVLETFHASPTQPYAAL